MREEPAARSFGRRLVQAIRDRPKNPRHEAENEDNRIFFRDIVVANRITRPLEYQRWVRKGWILDPER
ncbi:MAG TPA: hypothetical protein VN372_10310 [Methanospirillum sp.]|nr:hypothetical protein [Methanospirillum sp.]